jgi:hypothetical protein
MVAAPDIKLLMIRLDTFFFFNAIFVIPDLTAKDNQKSTNAEKDEK